ncbi:mechanosensitive ion channel protein MscS [Endozoicomonas montiporae]|uniref:Small-conductance mechanosensitive channel n=2 Tax=Endozoicomonas montiporae TaxID=1027273 RepID=A0A081N8P8_9GAMM|nr:mechanosensitive ion channel domain-containing protein [Endozoicomonas montiporae]AMO55275.1 mechanosensitive ion channel protein MscS [Endozoicomonas montiporae CL-33]KEQ14821.1 mechanosensitive ion channel protein MscS [Endozoicomonas montiporae]
MNWLTHTGWTNNFTNFGINLLIAIAIYLAGKWLARRIVKLIDKLMLKRQLDEVLRQFICSILSVLLSFVVVLIALEQVGVDTTSLLALLGAAGLAVGLALKDSLSNFASGVMLILFKPFKAGDFVEAGGSKGVVENVGMFTTQMRTADNKEINVPNANIYGSTIVNYSAKPTRRIDLVIGVGYDDDLKKAKTILERIVQSEPRILDEPSAVIAVSELADSSVNFVVRPWVKTADYWEVKWFLTEEIKLAFDAEGISIPYPQQDVHMHPVQSAA